MPIFQLPTAEYPCPFLSLNKGAVIVVKNVDSGQTAPGIVEQPTVYNTTLGLSVATIRMPEGDCIRLNLKYNPDGHGCGLFAFRDPMIHGNVCFIWKLSEVTAPGPLYGIKPQKKIYCCKKCNAKNEFAEANQKDGTYICYECR